MTNTPKDLADFNDGFIWTTDKGIDSWRVLRSDDFGYYKGDCDDYASTVAYIESGSSWPRFWWRTVMLQHVFWYSKTRGNGNHVILWVRGKGWIDNTNPAYGKRVLRAILPLPFFIPAFQLSLGAVQTYFRKETS
jgi:hypothetical protein